MGEPAIRLPGYAGPAMIFDFDSIRSESEKIKKKKKKNKKASENKKADKKKSSSKDKSSKKKKPKVIDIENVKKIKEIDEAEMARRNRLEAEKARREAERIRQEKEAEKHQAEADLIRLIARRNFLTNRLSRLNPGKRKDAVTIAAINIELNDIREAMGSIQTEYNIHMNDINQGSGPKRFFNKIKTGLHNAWEKTKKFCSKNKKLIGGLAAIILPVIGSIVSSFIMRG